MERWTGAHVQIERCTDVLLRGVGKSSCPPTSKGSGPDAGKARMGKFDSTTLAKHLALLATRLRAAGLLPGEANQRAAQALRGNGVRDGVDVGLTIGHQTT